jgi:hypothetical protein
MIDILIKLSIIFLIIIFIKSIIYVHKFNENAQLININDIEKITKGKKILDPLLLDYGNIEDIDFSNFVKENMNSHYEQYDTIIRLLDFYLNKDVYIYKNSKLLKDLKLKNKIEEIHSIFKLQLSNNEKYFLSVFQGNNKINLQKNIHDIMLIYCIDGACNINILNPKHKDLIDYKKDNLDKWHIDIELKEGMILYIPCEWYYKMETKEDCKLLHAESDTYFTSLYNEYRN